MRHQDLLGSTASPGASLSGAPLAVNSATPGSAGRPSGDPRLRQSVCSGPYTPGYFSPQRS